MGPTFIVRWNDMTRSFAVNDDCGHTSLPALPRHLAADLDAWRQHLSANFTPTRDDGLSAGRWANEEARWWFVHEAGRIERELAKVVPPSKGLIRISAYPGVTPIRFFNDHGSWPLWTTDGATGPEDFPMLSKRLRDDLFAWCDGHETRGIETEEDRDLLRRLRVELGPLYEVE